LCGLGIAARDNWGPGSDDRARLAVKVTKRGLLFIIIPARRILNVYSPSRTLSGMMDQTYLVALKLPSRAVQHVIAASLEIHGENLVFFNAKGELAAMFLMEIVQSWNVLPRGSA
jgi:hypothetical protein